MTKQATDEIIEVLERELGYSFDSRTNRVTFLADLTGAHPESILFDKEKRDQAIDEWINSI